MGGGGRLNGGGGGGWKEVLHGLGLRECCGWGGVGWGGVGGGDATAAKQTQRAWDNNYTTATRHTHFIPVNV